MSKKEVTAIKASEAYSDIKTYIDGAKKVATGANDELNNALNALMPNGTDSIFDNTSISVADSERLQIRIARQKEKYLGAQAVLQKLEENLNYLLIHIGIKARRDNLTIQLSTVDSNNWRNGLQNRNHDNTIRNLRGRISLANQEKVSRLIKEAINQTNKIKDVHRTLMDVSVAKQYEISKPFQKLLNLTTPESKTYFIGCSGW